MVTAERREQSVQDLGQTVTALTAEDLDRSNIEDIHDLQYQVPSLQVTGGLPRPTIRGIGQDIVAPSTDPGFILHINGTYVSQLAIALLGFHDMERAEVLPGPTGIEYGRATTGGSMNFIWNKARTDERTFTGDLLFGSYDNARLRSAVNFPIVENKLGMRIALAQTFAPQPFEVKGQTGLDQELASNTLGAGLALRQSLRFTPTEDFEADLIFQWTRDNTPGGKSRITDPFATYSFGQGMTGTGADARPCRWNDFNDCDSKHPIFGGPPDYSDATPNSSDPHTFTLNRGNDQRYETFWGQLKLALQLGDYTLTTNTNYQWWDYNVSFDWDGSDVDSERLDLHSEDTGWAHEVTFASNHDGPLNFLVGANLQNSHAPGVTVPIWGYQRNQDARNFLIFDAFDAGNLAPLAPVCGAGGNALCVFEALPENDTFFSLDADTDTTFYGLFARADWDISDTLRLTVGGRYSYTRREWEDRSRFDVYTEPFDVVFNSQTAGGAIFTGTCTAGIAGFNALTGQSVPTVANPAADATQAEIEAAEAECYNSYANFIWPGTVLNSLATQGGFAGAVELGATLAAAADGSDMDAQAMAQAALAASGLTSVQLGLAGRLGAHLAALPGILGEAGMLGALAQAGTATPAQLMRLGELQTMIDTPPINPGQVAFLSSVGPGSLVAGSDITGNPTSSAFGACDNPTLGNPGLGCPVSERRRALQLDQSWNSLDGLIRLEYRPNDEMLFYGYVSTGERHGGFNWFEASAFLPEEILAYELGAKTEWLDRTLIVNTAAFYYDYSNKFVTAVVGNVSTTQNIGDAEVMGVEVRIQYEPNPSLRVDASIGWLDSEILDDYIAEDNAIRRGNEDAYSAWLYQVDAAGNAVLDDQGNRVPILDAQGDPIPKRLGDRHGSGPTSDALPRINLKGNPLPRAPEWSVSVGIEYGFALANGATLTPRVDFAWRDESNLWQYNNPADVQEAYTQTDVRLRYTDGDGEWYLEGFIENVEDEDEILTGAESRTAHPQFWLADPRIYGLRLGWNFDRLPWAD